MDAAYHRHDINDKEWALLEPRLPEQRDQWGGIDPVMASSGALHPVGIALDGEDTFRIKHV